MSDEEGSASGSDQEPAFDPEEDARLDDEEARADEDDTRAEDEAQAEESDARDEQSDVEKSASDAEVGARRQKAYAEVFGEEDKDDHEDDQPQETPQPEPDPDSNDPTSVQRRLLEKLAKMPDMRKQKKQKEKHPPRPKKHQSDGEEGNDSESGAAKPKKRRRKKSEGEGGEGGEPKKRRKKEGGEEGGEKKRRKKPEGEKKERKKKKPDHPDASSRKRPVKPAGDTAGQEAPLDGEAEFNQENLDEEDGHGGSVKSEDDDALKNDLDLVLEAYKTRRKKPKRSQEEIREAVEEFLNKMQQACDADVQSNKEKKPAFARLKILPEVVHQLEKQGLRQAFLDSGVLHVLSRWLERMPDGSLPNLKLRTELFKLLHHMNLGSEEIDQIGKSGLGRLMMFYKNYPDEPMSNKKLVGNMIDQWSRPLFNLSTSYKDLRDADSDKASRYKNFKNPAMAKAEKSDDETKKPSTFDPSVRHARIPIKMQFNFFRRPESAIDVSEAPKSQPVDKLSSKGRLNKRMEDLRKPKGKIQRAQMVSVEGRGFVI